MKTGHENWYLECKEPNRSCSLSAVTREIAIYKLDLVRVQEVRCNNGDMVREGD
jgi:hypothetical protein